MENRRALDSAKVIDTIAALHRRISERFPGAGLAAVCTELHAIARENSARARQILIAICRCGLPSSCCLPRGLRVWRGSPG
jgi:hypothetical protein